MSEFNQSEESKKRMEELSSEFCSKNFNHPYHMTADGFYKAGYLAGMQDPESNAELLEDIESFLESFTSGMVRISTSILEAEELLKKLRERGKG